MSSKPFCRSCGHPSALQLPCSSCGASLVRRDPVPDDSIDGIGVKTAGTRNAGPGTYPIIQDHGRKWLVLAMNGTEVSLKKKGTALDSSLSEASRVQRWLYWCEHATSIGGFQQFWKRGIASASDEWDTRLIARWALSNERHSLLDDLHLSESEIIWLKVHAAIRDGKPTDALQLIPRLKDGTYPDVLDLLGHAISQGLSLAEARNVQDKLVALDPQHPVTLLLTAAPLEKWRNAEPVQAPVLMHLRQAGRFAAGESEDPPGSGPLAILAQIERSLDSGAPLPIEQLSVSTTTFDLALLWQERIQPEGVELGSSPAPLDEPWAPYADDVLEHWAALSDEQRTWLDSVISNSPDTAWGPLKHRLDVLRGEGEPGNSCEESRRAYAAGDWPYLRSAGDPGEYFLALADLRDGDATAIDRLRGHDCLPIEGKRTLDLLATVVSGQYEFMNDLVEDPTLWEPLVKLDLPPESIEDAPLRFREWHHLTRAKQALYHDHFAQAADLARECLRISTIEDIRDEALNLLGVALISQDNAETAAAAFDKAVEDAHSDRLLVNWAIAKTATASGDTNACWLEVAKQAEHQPLRAAAGLRVMANLDDDESIEAELSVIAKEVLFSPGDHDVAMAYLPIAGRHDSTWFQAQEWSASPFFERSAFKVRVALYHPNQDHLEVLGNLLRKHPNDEELLDIRDSVVDSVMAVMGGTDEEEDDQLGIAGWGLQMLDVVPLKPRQEAILSLWSVQVALQHFGRDYEDDELPGEGLLKFITRAEVLASDDQMGFDEDARRFVEGQATFLRDEYARQNLAWHAHAHDRAVDTYNGFIESIQSVGYGYRIDKQKVRAAAQEIADSCQRHITDITSAMELVSDEDLLKAGSNLHSSWKELRKTALGLKRRI